MSELAVVMHVPALKSGMPEGPYVDTGLASWGRPELTQALLDKGAIGV